MTYQYQKNVDGLYVCPSCGVTKERQNTMHYHMKTHEGKLPFQCNHCTKSFLQAYTLEIHKKAQHDKEESRLIKCPMEKCCFKGTVTKSNLLIHFVRKHCQPAVAKILSMNNELYHCSACNKDMKSSTAFYYHALSCIKVEDSTVLKHLKELQAI
jgi:uncharacterized Zn-finger protein